MEGGFCCSSKNCIVRSLYSFTWSHEEERVTCSCERLIDWLMEELEIGAMIVDYDGSDKE